MEIEKRKDENCQQYLWRVGSLKDAGVITQTWEELSPVLNEQTGITKRADVYRKEYAIAKKYLENVFLLPSVKTDSEIRAEVYKKQAQSKNVETNKWLREHARDELILEEIKEAVKQLTPLPPPPVIQTPVKDKVGVLCFGDEHFGTQFTIYGLGGEVINEYNDTVFYSRMWELLSKVKAIISDNELSDLYVFNFGDFVDGILRTSQLLKLQFGLVESTVKYAEFLCVWLDDLSRSVRIHFQMTPGNHTELRLIGQPKGTFKNENMDIVVKAFVKARLADNPNFYFTENRTNYIYEDIFGYKILGVHGEVSSTSTVVRDFSMIYNVKINYLLAGHKHHKISEECGIDTEFIGVPSIIGVDPYAMSLNFSSNPAATLLLFEDGAGLTTQYYLKLK